MLKTALRGTYAKRVGGAVLALATMVGHSLVVPTNVAAADGEAASFGRFGIDRVSVSDIVPIITPGDGPVSGASTLKWTKKGVGFDFNTTDLEPSAPYTMWWVTFNKPKNCDTPCACGLDDLDDPRVDAGVFFAGGRMSDAAGQAVFAGEIDYGELPQGEDQVPFPGIEAPIKRTAEVHLVVRDHGPALDDPAALKAQLTEFNGGCPPNSCVDVQASIHPSPFCRARSRH